GPGSPAARLRDLHLGLDRTPPRSFELLVALYAVHKAGAAYLPIDVGHPAERVRFMLADADPVVVVTQETYPQLAAEGAAAAPLEPVDLDPRQPAYVIYTSGSTGRPKGVLVPHAGVVNHLRWKQSAFPLTAGDRVLHKTPVTFDVSVWELFWPLATGATLVIACPDGHRDPAYLAGLIQREGISLAHFVPSMLETFLDLPEAAGCTTLRRVICSGEALPQNLADRFHSVLGAELHNLYGPTEASVEIAHGQSRPGSAEVSVPIGRPIANSRVYVLGPGLRPAPTGTPGDLYLAGVQLAHGYQGRLGLTADRFVADPFGPPGSRMYRTGDVARWTEEGTLVFLGRSDDQVKIRGFRIELGEIEALLLRRPEVRRAAVLVREDQPGVKRLVAYVVISEDGADGADGFDEEALRGHVAGELPEYMVPQAFVPLPDLPLTTSGKLDRRALPAPRFAAAVQGRAAASERERTLCALFAEVLGVEQVGPEDGFFTLGGDSIQSIQLVARARRAGLALTPRDVFTCRTPAALALRVQEAAEPQDQPADAGVGSFAPTPIMHWLREHEKDRSAGFNQSMLVRTPRAAALPTLSGALQALLDRHDALRMRLVVEDGNWSIEVPPPGAVSATDVLTRVDTRGLGERAL
ncbi:amino acid adenylation domain-containing protein, partial [Streptomyces shenzhenensis]|uniref:amino acid adenylation domain-containing protein n=1 Tax=Streptomyces shenzhenensis TaxID=943815 RepID=UPI0015F0BC02